MNIIKLTAADILAPASLRGHFSAITIGVFDGLHLGHRKIIETMRAAGGDGPVALVTFSAHPRAILSHRAPVRVLDPALRRRILEEWNVGTLVELEISSELFNLDGESFARGLKALLDPDTVVIGPNFAFGKGRSGNEETLRTIFGDVRVVEPLLIRGEPASATRLREALSRADFDLFTEMTGREHVVFGTIERGDGIGGSIGSPTLNLAPAPDSLPDGVYAVRVGGVVPTVWARGVAHIGPRPTFDRIERRFEVHLLDGAPKLSCDDLEVMFHARLREVRNFGCAESLSEQIILDIAATRKMLQ